MGANRPVNLDFDGYDLNEDGQKLVYVVTSGRDGDNEVLNICRSRAWATHLIKFEYHYGAYITPCILDEADA